MEAKKYRLTENQIKRGEKILYQIEALKDFGMVKAGDLGGYIESEENLSQDNDAWVSGNAWVVSNARVSGNAWVDGNAQVSGNAWVYGYARVSGAAQVSGNAWVYGDAQVSGNAWVYDNARVSGDALVLGDARVSGAAQVSGNAWVYGNAQVSGDAEVKSREDYIVFKNWWSSARYFTWTRSNNMWKVGCFFGTGKELIKEAYNDSDISGREYERIVRYVEEIMGENYGNKEKAE